MPQALFSSESENKVLGQFLPPKVFTQPFRLAFKHPEQPGMAIWVEIRSLEGLRNVFERVESGELVEMGRFSTVEMQLWGHLAEHGGFLRIRGNVSTLAAGIQPLGEGIAPLVEDLGELMGGGDDMKGLAVLDQMQKTLRSRACGDAPMDRLPVTNEFIKPDGVNLTKNGENALLNLVHGTGNVNMPERSDKTSEEAIAFRKESENAMEIFLVQTPPATEEEIESEAKEAIDCEIAAETGNTEGPIVISAEAASVGRLVAAVGRGLDREPSEDDEAVREEAQTAMDILNAMIEIEDHGLAGAKKRSQDLLEYYGVTMDEIKDLAVTAGQISKKTNQSPREALRATDENIQKLMKNFSEIDLAMLVGQSPPEEATKHEQRAGLDLEQRRLQEQQRGPASMDTYREEAQRQDPSYGTVAERIRCALDVPENPRSVHGPIDGEAFDIDEMRRLSGLDKPKSNDEGDPSK